LLFVLTVNLTNVYRCNTQYSGYWSRECWPTTVVWPLTDCHQRRPTHPTGLRRQSACSLQLAITWRRCVCRGSPTVDTGDGAPSDVGDLFQCYNDTLRSLVDVHVPLRMVSRRSSGLGRSARWYDAECRMEKAKTRWLERFYRRSPTSEAWSRWRWQFSRQRKLLQQKATMFWLTAISPCNGDSRSIIHVDEDQRVTDATITWIIRRHFSWRLCDILQSKSNLIRVATASAPAPVLSTRTSTSRLSLFEPVMTDEVRHVLRTVLAKKHCLLEPVPTWLVKKSAEDIIPVICHLCNTSLECCHLSSETCCRQTPTLDTSELNSYCPISNLSLSSKLLEHIVMARYTTHAE